MQETYRINICGLERDLPVCPLHGNLYIAGFVMFGDVEMTETCAAELLKRCPEHDLVLTAESKGIPLAYEMARQEKGKYLVARKGLKLYMKNPISVEVQSITTARLQTLYIDQADADRMKGRRILIVDDVVPAIRRSLRAKFTRAKNNALTRNAIRSQVIVELEDRIEREIIEGYDNLTVTALESDPTTCLVEFEFTVVHGLNRIFLTAHISV